MGTLYINIFNIIYLGLVNPRNSSFRNKLNLLNEFLIHILVMLVIVFTDFVEDIES